MFARVRYAGPGVPSLPCPREPSYRTRGTRTCSSSGRRGEFERREVSLGPRRKDAVVVTKGLATGDRVVVDGTMLLIGQ